MQSKSRWRRHIIIGNRKTAFSIFNRKHWLAMLLRRTCEKLNDTNTKLLTWQERSDCNEIRSSTIFTLDWPKRNLTPNYRGTDIFFNFIPDIASSTMIFPSVSKQRRVDYAQLPVIGIFSELMFYWNLINHWTLLILYSDSFYSKNRPLARLNLPRTVMLKWLATDSSHC